MALIRQVSISLLTVIAMVLGILPARPAAIKQRESPGAFNIFDDLIVNCPAAWRGNTMVSQRLQFGRLAAAP